MKVNRGKQFEQVIRECFEKVPGVSIDRLHDQTTGYLGSKNICDFIVYKEPYEYYFECKTIRGNTFPFTNITDRQWEGLFEKSKIQGVFAGVIVWWVDKDTTIFIPIQELIAWRALAGKKSIRYDDGLYSDLECYPLVGKKKRVFFDYDMEVLLNAIQSGR